MKVFICFNNSFPRKNASSNYIQYLAKALLPYVDDVYLIGTTSEVEQAGKWVEYQGMVYCNIFFRNSSKKDNLYCRMMAGDAIWRKMKEKKITEGDVIICYSKNFFLMYSIYKKARKNKIKVTNCIVEWYTAKQFKWGYFDIYNYWYYRLGFAFGVGISKNVIVISRKLEEHFKKRGCKTLLFPPLADPYELEYKEIKLHDKIRFVYSGKFKKKDSMDVMLNAFMELEKDELSKVEFHITGNTKADILNELPIEKYDYAKLKNVLFIHDWLTYDELVDLYNQSHFLLLARPENCVTLSNFPSKIPEVMGYGVIPIMTSVGDCPKLYLKDNIDSILFNDCSVEQCKNAIQKALALSDSERVRMQKNARKKAEEIFYYANWAKKIVDFIV